MNKYIVSSVVSTAMLVSPVVALAQVQGDVPPDQGQSSCITLQYNLQYRSLDASTNGEVSELQDFLQSKGYLNSEPTGYFGLLTAAAVKSFQAANGILNSGYVGPITRAKITEVSCATMVTDYIPTTSLLPAGCLSGYLYSTLTGEKCVPKQQSTYPSGCSSTIGYSSTTGKKCDGTTINTTVPASYTVSGQVKCVFSGATTKQKCWGDVPSPTVGEPTRYSCVGVETCVMTVEGLYGTPVTWGSSCGGSADTTISGDNKYANFSCKASTTKAPQCELNVKTTEGLVKSGLTGTGYYDGSGSGYVEIHQGEGVIISWSSTNADYSEGPGGSLFANGSETYYPEVDKSYVWNFYGPGGSTPCGVMVEVVPAKKPICSVSAKPYTVMAGESTTLTWTSENATHAAWQQDNMANILGLSVDTLFANGSETVLIGGGKGIGTATLLVYSSTDSGSCSTSIAIE